VDGIKFVADREIAFAINGVTVTHNVYKDGTVEFSTVSGGCSC
jgi:hypothetical protein